MSVGDWEHLEDKEKSFHNKASRIVSRLHGCGLTHPSEKTIAGIVALLACVNLVDPIAANASLLYAWVDQVKHLFQAWADSKIPTMFGPHNWSTAPEGEMLNNYKDDPPAGRDQHPCFFALLANAPCTSTKKALGNCGSAAALDVASGGGSSTCNMTSQPAAAHAFMNILQQMMTQFTPQPQQQQPQIQFLGSASASSGEAGARALLAISPDMQIAHSSAMPLKAKPPAIEATADSPGKFEDGAMAASPGKFEDGAKAAS